MGLPSEARDGEHWVLTSDPQGPRATRLCSFGRCAGHSVPSGTLSQWQQRAGTSVPAVAWPNLRVVLLSDGSGEHGPLPPTSIHVRFLNRRGRGPGGHRHLHWTPRRVWELRGPGREGSRPRQGPGRGRGGGDVWGGKRQLSVCRGWGEGQQVSGSPEQRRGRYQKSAGAQRVLELGVWGCDMGVGQRDATWGGRVAPPNYDAGALSPRTSECDCGWSQGV